MNNAEQEKAEFISQLVEKLALDDFEVLWNGAPIDLTQPLTKELLRQIFLSGFNSCAWMLEERAGLLSTYFEETVFRLGFDKSTHSSPESHGKS